VSRGRKAHPVLKAGDEDDGDDLARQCPISFSIYLLPVLCSLGPLILSPILFYFFFSCSLSLFFSFFFFVFSPCFSPVFSPCSCICVLVLQEKWTVPGELIHVALFTVHLNSVRWINSLALEQCQLNFTWYCSHEQCLHCSLDRVWPGKFFLFF